ncbi:MAG: S-methyl-5'-thioadenosine phosphorylase, partial [Candidatus Syntrophonatronum acetioxidans]
MYPRIAVIGGTGVYDPEILENVQEEEVKTPYGGVNLFLGSYKGKEVYFMARHGRGHSVPPHKINYRANIWALKEVGVSRIISTAAVGSINKEMPPGSLVLIDQFIDFTKQRALSFFEGEEGEVIHTDFTEPYCPQLREVIKKAGEGFDYKIFDYGTYVCCEGPRFETPAEIKMFEAWGGDVAGMTNVPEVVLAREIGLCYTTISLVANYAAGISKNILSHEEVLEMMGKNIDGLR